MTEAGAMTEQTRDLGLAFPTGLFSLSHVALPFPMYDSLYGLQPDEPENFGVNLGAIAPRGERGVLIVDLDALVRVSSNPFFPYIRALEDGHGRSRPKGGVRGLSCRPAQILRRSNAHQPGGDDGPHGATRAGAASATPMMPNMAPRMTMANRVQAGGTLTASFWISGATTKPSMVWMTK